MSKIVALAFIAVGLVLSFLTFPVGLVIGVPLLFWGLNQMGIKIKSPT